MDNVLVRQQHALMYLDKTGIYPIALVSIAETQAHRPLPGCRAAAKPLQQNILQFLSFYRPKMVFYCRIFVLS
jgi:hypothetical protein